jgi:hypothetical protein
MVAGGPVPTFARFSGWLSRKRAWVMYGLSVLCYIAITFFTKRLLTWNLAMVYFVVTLEVLPRTYRRIRAAIS